MEEYETRVIHQLLELWYRYIVDVLSDAQVYSEHAGNAAIDCEDVKLAIQSKVDFSFSQPPPREVIYRTPFIFFHLPNLSSCNKIVREECVKLSYVILYHKAKLSTQNAFISLCMCVRVFSSSIILQGLTPIIRLYWSWLFTGVG